jgi:hypothetical protein
MVPGALVRQYIGAGVLYLVLIYIVYLYISIFLHIYLSPFISLTISVSLTISISSSSQSPTTGEAHRKVWCALPIAIKILDEKTMAKLKEKQTSTSVPDYLIPNKSHLSGPLFHILVLFLNAWQKKEN